MPEQPQQPRRRSHINTADYGENLTFHPYNIALALLLFSLAILFLALSAAFIYSRVQSELPPVRLPLIFLFNTLILVASSYTMIRAKRAYRDDDTQGYQRMLLLTVILSFAFLFAQIVGWRALFNQNVTMNSDVSASYLYLISGLHFAHVIAGLPFLGVFLYQAYRYMKEPVSVLVYFSDPAKRLKLRLLTIYWHFLDALWIYLVLFFFVNYLIRTSGGG
jgi:cytochrome c oxidase subunit 3